MRGGDRPSVIALAGPNGAGKTTAGPALLRDTLGIQRVVNADTIAQGLAGFAPEAAAIRAGRILLEQIDRLARRREDFAFETTLAGRAYAHRLEALIESGYRFGLLYLWLPDVRIAIERVADRVRRGGHGVPLGVIRARYTRGLRNFFSVYRPMASTWQLYDSSGRTPRLIAKGDLRQTLRVLQPDRWEHVLNSMRDGRHGR